MRKSRELLKSQAKRRAHREPTRELFFEGCPTGASLNEQPHNNYTTHDSTPENNKVRVQHTEEEQQKEERRRRAPPENTRVEFRKRVGLFGGEREVRSLQRY